MSNEIISNNFSNIDVLFNELNKFNPMIACIAGGTGTGKTTHLVQSFINIIKLSPILKNGRKYCNGVIMRKLKKDIDETIVSSIEKVFGVSGNELKDDDSTKTGNRVFMFRDISFCDKVNGAMIHKYYADLKLTFMSWSKEISSSIGGTEMQFVLLEELNTFTDHKIIDRFLSRINRNINVSKNAPTEIANRYNELIKKYNNDTITEEEQREKDKMDEDFRKGNCIMISMNTVMEYIENTWVESILYNKERYKLSQIQYELIQYGEIRSERRNFQYVLQFGHNLKSPLFKPPNPYISETYRRSLKMIADPAKRRADYEGKFTLLSNNKIVFENIYSDEEHFERIGFRFNPRGFFDRANNCNPLFDAGVVTLSNVNKITEEDIVNAIKYSLATKFIIGLDFGGYPAMVCMAYVVIQNELYIRVLHEFTYPNGTNEPAFSDDVVRYVKRNGLEYRDLTLVGDPSSKIKNTQTDRSASSLFTNRLMNARAINFTYMGNNGVAGRINAVENMLKLKPINNKNVKKFAIYKNACVLLEGFRVGYRYAETDNSDDSNKKIYKKDNNPFTHPMDALQYCCLHLSGIMKLYER